MALIKCSECGAEISKQAKICPNCGSKSKKNRRRSRNIKVALVAVIVLIIMVSTTANKNKGDSTINISDINVSEYIVDEYAMSDETGVSFSPVMSNLDDWDSMSVTSKANIAQATIEYFTDKAKSEYGFQTTAVTAENESGIILFIGVTGGTLHLWSEGLPSDDRSWNGEIEIEATNPYEKMGLTEEQESALIQELAQCSLTNIESITENATDEYQTSYYVDDKTHTGIILMYLSNETKALNSLYYNDELVYENGQVVQTIEYLKNKPALELIEGSYEGTASDFSITITGTVRNNSGKDYSYVQITFDCYDSAGNKIGQAMDNVSGLKAGETWRFSAICIGDARGGQFRLDEVTGW